VRGSQGRRLLIAVMGLIAIVCVGVIAANQAIRWRATVVLDKATGRLIDIGWSDLAWMLRPGSGVYLGGLADSRNPFVEIVSPRRSKSDLEAGKQLFRDHCSSCHGGNGQGAAGGPSLRDHEFREGRSDWALYRSISRGIPGTAMVGVRLPRDDLWRLVSYLNRTILVQNAEALSSGLTPEPALLEPVAAAELREASNHPAEWLTYSGSNAAHRFSSLRQIDRDNVGRLRVEWERQFSETTERVETSPIVRGSIMYVTEPPNHVLALDAASGRVLWTYSRDLPSRLLLCCGSVNRGVALLGSRVFVGTLDAHLVALDANTGSVLWDVAVADPSTGYSITGAPLVVDDMVVTGVAGGEFGVQGFVDAYDAASGNRRWRFYTLPAPGQPGSETWKGNSLQSGGAPTWLTGSFDPELRMIYWGVGNPSPNFSGEDRSGDNLYTNAVVALDADSGKLRWYFQFTPHDLHDWDSVQIPVLLDAVVDGSKRKLLAWANRNGFYYLLDRATGEFLLGTPFVKQTWANALDSKGRPRVRSESIPSLQGAIVYPGALGGTNWWSPAYDPELQLMYVPALERGGIFYATPSEHVEPDGETNAGVATPVPNEDPILAVKALEVTTGRVRWEWEYDAHPQNMKGEGGLLSTAGRLVFGGMDESFFALDAATGAELWRFEAGGQISAAPVSYQLAGRQYVAIAAGRTILAFALAQADLRRKTRATGH
jgi:alcohol dehydrogenase (cytochrome c)